jgi:hypothetical protein
MRHIAESKTFSTPLAGPDFAFFQIKSKTDVTINIKISEGYAEAYFQFIKYDG